MDAPHEVDATIARWVEDALVLSPPQLAGPGDDVAAELADRAFGPLGEIDKP